MISVDIDPVQRSRLEVVCGGTRWLALHDNDTGTDLSLETLTIRGVEIVPVKPRINKVETPRLRDLKN
jgi:hypothetical protein